MIENREEGLYCPAGDFYVDPLLPVRRAVVTHAHGDHACPGCGHYLAAEPGLELLKERLGAEASIEPIRYGETVTQQAARISLFPAGHILGSAQVRIEVAGEVWVVSGDYKTAPDATCQGFEPVECHTFVTESTFGLWDEGRLVPVAKAYSGLTDAEIREVDRFVRSHTIDRFGPVRVVRPELVFELHFDGIQVSQRHKAGLAVRFPRMARWRLDKQPAEADTLDALRALASATAGTTRRSHEQRK